MSEKQSCAKSGVRNPRAKLSARDVRAIRKYAQRDNLKYGWKSALARKYGISPVTLGDLLKGKSWQGKTQ